MAELGFGKNSLELIYSFRRLLFSVILLLICDYALMGLIFYNALNVTEPKTFATTTDGRILPIKPNL